MLGGALDRRVVGSAEVGDRAIASGDAEQLLDKRGDGSGGGERDDAAVRGFCGRVGMLGCRGLSGGTGNVDEDAFTAAEEETSECGKERADD